MKDQFILCGVYKELNISFSNKNISFAKEKSEETNTYVSLLYVYIEERYAHLRIWMLVFNATFSNISGISWRPVLVVEEAGVPGENHRPWASNW